MKRISTYLMGFSLLAIITISCSKEGHQETRQQAAAPQVITATVPAGETYVLNLGTGNAVSIKAQALHHQISEISIGSNGNLVYKYIAAKGYAGPDEVMLEQTVTSTTQGRGCYGSNNENYTTTALKTIAIKFNVAN